MHERILDVWERTQRIQVFESVREFFHFFCFFSFLVCSWESLIDRSLLPEILLIIKKRVAECYFCTRSFFWRWIDFLEFSFLFFYPFRFSFLFLSFPSPCLSPLITWANDFEITINGDCNILHDLKHYRWFYVTQFVKEDKFEDEVQSERRNNTTKRETRE
jgi:hypothetical protein